MTCTLRGHALTSKVNQGKLAKDEVLELDAARSAIQLSPFERFRGKRNALSVTDLVNPLWCQSQFQYSLEKGGRKRQTPAMKRGGEIHAALESEVHVTVAFQVEKDERRALQMLRMLCCLIELEIHGITRELPVFGITNGILVAGIIDELRMTNNSVPLSQEQKLMKNFLSSPAGPGRAIVMIDSKTRVSATEPALNQMNQVKLQLMLYWQFFRDLPKIDMQRIYSDEKLDRERPFSDGFLAQAMELVGSYSDSVADDILTHNNLDGLWSLLRNKLLRMQTVLSDEVTVRYIHQKSKNIISERSFPVDLAWANEQTTRVLEWWKGDKEAKGIEIEEAYKCKLCEFEAGCTWRLKRVQEVTEINRERNRVAREQHELKKLKSRKVLEPSS